jgi:hypothetical protein
MNIDAVRELEQDAVEDIFFGQVVMIWARWFLIAAGTIFFLWTATNATELSIGVLPIVALVAVNFYLHGRYFLERPSNVMQITAASAIDIGLVSAIVLLWHSGTVAGRTGLASPFLVLYYPVLLALAYVLPRRLTMTFTVATAAIYTAVCLPEIDSIANGKLLVLRVVTMAAMGALGSFYWRIQRDRRRSRPGVAG